MKNTGAFILKQKKWCGMTKKADIDSTTKCCKYSFKP